MWDDQRGLGGWLYHKWREDGSAVTKVTMDVPPARASQMAQFFIGEGFEVSWDAPLEKRAGGEKELVQIVF